MAMKRLIKPKQIGVLKSALDRPLVDFHLSVEGLDRDVHKFVGRMVGWLDTGP